MTNVDILNVFNMGELEELYITRQNLEDRIEDYFDGGTIYHGDEGYQTLLWDLEQIEEDIERLEQEND